MRRIPRRMALVAIAATITAPAFGYSTGELKNLLGDKDQPGAGNAS